MRLYCELVLPDSSTGARKHVDDIFKDLANCEGCHIEYVILPKDAGNAKSMRISGVASWLPDEPRPDRGGSELIASSCQDAYATIIKALRETAGRSLVAFPIVLSL